MSNEQPKVFVWWSPQWPADPVLGTLTDIMHGKDSYCSWVSAVCYINLNKAPYL